MGGLERKQSGRLTRTSHKCGWSNVQGHELMADLPV